MKGWIVVGTAIAITAAPLTQRAEARPKCERVWVSSIPATDTGKGGPVFSATKILDVRVHVLLPPVTPSHPLPKTVTVRVFTPNGHHYQTATVPVAAEGSKEKERKLKGYRFPLKTSRARAYQDRGVRWNIVDVFSLPVAGTSITTSSLYGTWRVQVWPAGADSSCDTTFVLRP